MQLDALLGNDALKDTLRSSLAGKRLPHAVLLAGADGCGRGFAARCLAADYLFPMGGPGAQAVMQQESAEVILVQGEGKSGQIPVERIRAVRAEIFHSSLSSEAGRVVWIKDAHRMAAPAFNALLKVLEEPPAGALFILTAPSASSLPMTILSRCSLFVVSPVSGQVCEQELQKALPEGASPTLPALLSAVYGGRIGTGLAVLQDAERLSVLQDALAFANASAEKSRYKMLCVLARYEGRAEADRPKREALLADVCAAMEACLCGDKTEGLPQVDSRQAAAVLPVVEECRVSLRGNVAPKIAFAALTARVARAF